MQIPLRIWKLLLSTSYSSYYTQNSADGIQKIPTAFKKASFKTSKVEFKQLYMGKSLSIKPEYRKQDPVYYLPANASLKHTIRKKRFQGLQQ